VKVIDVVGVISQNQNVDRWIYEMDKKPLWIL